MTTSLLPAKQEQASKMTSADFTYSNESLSSSCFKRLPSNSLQRNNKLRREQSILLVRVSNNECISYGAVGEAKLHYTIDMIPQVDVTVIHDARRSDCWSNQLWICNATIKISYEHAMLKQWATWKEFNNMRGMSRIGTGSTTNLTNSIKFSLIAVKN